MVYQALNTRVGEIRLLQIVQPPDDVLELPADKRPMYCTLDHYPIDDQHRLPPGSPRFDPKKRSQFVWGDYTALSYTWGKKGITREIFINGESTLVTVNLEHALRVLRDSLGVGAYVWVDVLCINQASITERNIEVGRMKDIYKRANDVCIWLGDEKPGSNDAFDFVNTLGPVWRGDPEELRQVLRKVLAAYGPGIWKSFVGIIDREYWYRVWVLQEMAMGTEDSPIMCGQKRVKWQYFTDTVWAFNHANEDATTGVKRIISEEMNAEHQTALSTYRVYWMWSQFPWFSDFKRVLSGSSENEPNYERVYEIMRRALCTEPRDKVYGILALMKDSFAKLIIIDYNLPLVQVYKQFVLAWFQDRGDMDALSFCGARLNDDFPSWIPDLRFRFFRTLTVASPEEPNYKAPGSLTPEWSVQENEKLTLTVKGILVDKVDGLGVGNWASHEREVFGDWAIIQSMETGNAYETEEDLREAIWQTLVLGRSLVGTKAPGNYRFCLDKAFLDEPDGDDPMADNPHAIDEFNETRRRLEIRTENNIRRNIRMLVKRSRAFLVAGKPLEDYLIEVDSNIRRERYYLDSLDRVDRTSWSRRLGTTTKGFVGLFPDGARQGDVVVIIAGCNCPMLLRAHGVDYKFVDPVYLHGVMNGELIQNLGHNGYELQDITLA